MIVAGTGHRPEDCGDERVVRLQIAVQLRYKDIERVISGAAAGFDLWLADEARKLEIPLTFARPWTGHEPRVDDRKLYAQLMQYADQVVNVTEAEKFPGAWCYHKRNEWMVDNCTHVMAYLNPEKTHGGTYSCVQYAKKVGKPVRNIWGDPPF